MLPPNLSVLSLDTLRQRIREHRLVDPVAWTDRCFMWLAAAAGGLCVVGFTWLTELAAKLFGRALEVGLWVPFLLTPLGGMLVVWATRRFAAGAAGSGIPQVMSALSPDLPVRKINVFVSVWLSICKAVLGALALGVGFSAGREGPSVQISAGIMHAFRRRFSRQSRVSRQELMLAGGAAGIAAAFNAPLAGVIFAIEEMSRRFEQRSSGTVVTAIILSGLVSISLQGNFNYFGDITINTLPAHLFIPAILCAVIAGLLGGLFSRLLIVSTQGSRDRISGFSKKHPIWFAGACGLVIAMLGLVSHGEAFGSGYQYSREVLAGQETLPFLFVGVKFLATWLSFWSGVPGGIFAPVLAIGAGLGNDIALLMHVAVTPMIAIGMVGLLAGATQAPITSFIIVMEMIGGHVLVLSLMAAALISSMISKLLSPPLYHSLSQLQLAGLGIGVDEEDEAKAKQEAAAPETPAAAASATAPEATDAPAAASEVSGEKPSETP